MSKGSQPKTPDPAKVSAAQTQSNKDTAAFNAALGRIDQSSPFGSINYTQSGTDPTTGAPIYSQQTTLSEPLQNLFNSQIGNQTGISSAITGALGNLPTGAFDASGINTDNIRDASYQRQVTQLTPQFEEGARNLTGMLSDRGIPIGSEIYNNEQNRYDTAKNTALTQASRQAELDAGAEQSRQFGQLMQEYQLPYSTLSSLLGGSQSVGSPQFSSVPQAQAAGTDTAGNTWAAYQANQQNAQNQQNQLWSGLLGAGQLGLAAFSDRRLKRDIKRIGAMPSGLPVYSYRYLWSDEPQVGVMAQEALHYRPDSVVVHDSGFLMVNYGLL